MGQRIDVTLGGLHELQDRIDQKQLNSGDWPIFGALVANLVDRAEAQMDRAQAKADALAEQERAGRDPNASSETNGPEKAGGENDATPQAGQGRVGDPTDPSAPANHASPQGHGRNGADAFTTAKHLSYELPEGTLGSLCPRCGRIRMKRYRRRTVIRIIGQPLFSAEIHAAAQARCCGCGEIITAKLPAVIEQGIGKAVIYHWTACSLLIILHYTAQMPFKRLEMLHQSWGIPFSDANQWEVVSQAMDLLMPLVRAMERHGIERILNLRIDDTGSMVITIQRQILDELEAARALGLPTESIRTGINATCVHIETPEGEITLFFTGRHHAGEIIDRILKQRKQKEVQVIKVTDGASKNFDHEHRDQVIEATCNAHAFLKFHAIKDQFPVEYAVVGEAYHEIFQHDAITRERKMTPEQRLAYHREHSRPWMDKIRAVCLEKMQSRLVEPRSPLWAPVHFIINQWSRLSRFLEVPGVPLDTNLVEQKLIIPVRYLAASFNYQTENGAEVGDAAMSLVATARAHGVEPVAYLAHCLENHKYLQEHPENYLPWVYREQMKARASPSAGALAVG